MCIRDRPYEVLVEQLTKLRKEQSLTQKELAERLGKPQSFVSKYESGERKLDVIEFILISQQIGVDPKEAFSKFFDLIDR